ncbi:glycosyltransferase [Flavobacterium amniphilum]|uniref:glycosyltransferase family 2 protein n=1 Tax=Flavobacterium amniphilum TaxID=1834035 RepID=UPI00202A98A0|nr:glycosyltransferase [Flavobacterium amniphilum]MCL9804925.1 glycosyltransferase [Flavobacterium amniphilum]
METGIIIITSWYLFNILWLIYGFAKVKSFVPENTHPINSFSVIVPFRNEAHNLPKLLESFNRLNYPVDLFEVILVDDDSEEKFQIPNSKFRVSLIENERKTNSPKKDAINTAIQKARNTWIVTTDADCIVPKNWLAAFDSFIQQYRPKMIASGVYYQTGNSILDCFQQLDLLSLQGTTIGSFGNSQAFMCNGANFSYRKDFFGALGGFKGNSTIASGDDVFLLQKAILKEETGIHFIKSNQVLVQTQTEKSWSGLFHQRVRWASKTGNYNGIYSKQLGLSVFLTNFIWILTLILSILGLIDYKFLVLFILVKFSIDSILILKTAHSYRIRIKYLITCSVIYPFFSTGVVFYSFFGSYNWKGRTFKM